MFADQTTPIPFVVPWAALAISLVIPLIVALVAKSTASPGTKGLLTVFLSAVTAAGTVYVQRGGSVPAVDLVAAFFAVLVAAHTSYKVAWKPLGTVDTVQDAVPGGIGAAQVDAYGD